MQEVFYEETATVEDSVSSSRKYNLFKWISIVFYVLTAAWILIYINFYLSDFSYILLDLIVFLIPLVGLFLSGFFIGKLKYKFYVDYDYTFISGSIRISQVFNNVKRKFLIDFETSDIEKIGLYGSKTFYAYENMAGINKQVYTQNETPCDDKKFYYMVVNTHGEKMLMLFECKELFITNVLKFTKRTVLEEELLRK